MPRLTRFKCRLCSAIFYNGADYKNHWSGKHKNISGLFMYESPYHCSSCQEYFKNYRALVQHLSCPYSKCYCAKNKTDEYRCKDCNKTYVNDVCFQMHLQYSVCQSKFAKSNKEHETDGALGTAPVTATAVVKSIELLDFDVKMDEQIDYDAGSNLHHQPDDGNNNVVPCEGLTYNKSNAICGAINKSNSCSPKSEEIIGERNLFDSFCIKNETNCNESEQPDVKESLLVTDNEYTSDNVLPEQFATVACLYDADASACSSLNAHNMFENENGYLGGVSQSLHDEPATEIADNIEAKSDYLYQPLRNDLQEKQIGKTDHRIPCRICSKQFDNIRDYQKHFTRVHPEYTIDDMFDDGWKCSLCFSVHKHASGLRMHWERSHKALYDKQLFTQFIENEMNNSGVIP